MSSSMSCHWPPSASDPLRLDAQELLLVVPLVERLGLVEALVALQADEPGARHLGHRLGQLGLARAGRTLDEDRLLEAVGEVDDTGDAFVREVVDLLQTVADCGHRLEAVIHASFFPLALWFARTHRVTLPVALTGRSRQFGMPLDKGRRSSHSCGGARRTSCRSPQPRSGKPHKAPSVGKGAGYTPYARICRSVIRIVGVALTAAVHDSLAASGVEIRAGAITGVATDGGALAPSATIVEENARPRSPGWSISGDPASSVSLSRPGPDVPGRGCTSTHASLTAAPNLAPHGVTPGAWAHGR